MQTVDAFIIEEARKKTEREIALAIMCEKTEAVLQKRIPKEIREDFNITSAHRFSDKVSVLGSYQYRNVTIEVSFSITHDRPDRMYMKLKSKLNIQPNLDHPINSNTPNSDVGRIISSYNEKIDEVISKLIEMLDRSECYPLEDIQENDLLTDEEKATYLALFQQRNRTHEEKNAKLVEENNEKYRLRQEAIEEMEQKKINLNTRWEKYVEEHFNPWCYFEILTLPPVSIENITGESPEADDFFVSYNVTSDTPNVDGYYELVNTAHTAKFVKVLTPIISIQKHIMDDPYARTICLAKRVSPPCINRAAYFNPRQILPPFSEE